MSKAPKELWVIVATRGDELGFAPAVYRSKAKALGGRSGILKEPGVRYLPVKYILAPKRKAKKGRRKP